MRVTPFVLVAVVGLAGVSLAARQSGTTGTNPEHVSDQEFLKGAYLPTTPDLVAPIPKETPKPRYTPDAMRNKIQGTVGLQVIVDDRGGVARVRVLESLDTVYGLDEAAMAVAKLWKFEPGRLNGRAVPVAVKLELQFRLH